MNSAPGLTQEEFEAELDARGFEPTDEYTPQGRVWKKKGVWDKPFAHLHVPSAVDGRYPEWLLWLVRQRIQSINNWIRPKLVSDSDDTKER